MSPLKQKQQCSEFSLSADQVTTVFTKEKYYQNKFERFKNPHEKISRTEFWFRPFENSKNSCFVQIYLVSRLLWYYFSISTVKSVHIGVSSRHWCCTIKTPYAYIYYVGCYTYMKQFTSHTHFLGNVHQFYVPWKKKNW